MTTPVVPRAQDKLLFTPGRRLYRRLPPQKNLIDCAGVQAGVVSMLEAVDNFDLIRRVYERYEPE